ncbi:SDR family oxidoreductase [Geodermatophilus sp. YIM 151500]|uniref:SDR family NAD(P)-dependent oxidoreductase n=1 Tax=Geodermatophilus sp. YIM 151500 TaxID=2984531 RepID=UPI0021E4B393|nr:SDR family oxidoreductase [Geodermatophilus sp. YIM 151500]MCV2488849.1 SDR family oxidoreductase [Geodermatophilus sp. YIM 151500]
MTAAGGTTVGAAGGGGLLAGAVAAVTGAGTGIGREIALRLAAEGADVVLTGRSTGPMEEVAGQVRAGGRRALVVPMDLRDPASIRAAAEAAEAEFGRVDVLVNNSGVGGPSKPMWEIDPEEWEDTFRVNVTGTFLACRAFLPGMVARRSGSVVVIGSVTGKRPLVNRTPYAASKTALIGMVRTLAWELGPHGVRVNLVSPGGVEGERIEWVLQQQAQARGITVEEARADFAEGSPLKRLVPAGDVAHAVAWLASPRSASVTGDDLNVSAGLVMY